MLIPSAPERDVSRSASTLNAGMQDIWERGQVPLMAKLARIEDAVIALVADDLEEGLRAEAEAAAHQIAGAAGMFGFHVGSVLASELETLFEKDSYPAEGERALGFDQVRGLRQALISARFRRDGPGEPADDFSEDRSEALAPCTPQPCPYPGIDDSKKGLT